MKFKKKLIEEFIDEGNYKEDSFFDNINKKLSSQNESLTEDFTYTNEQIKSCIEDVDVCYNDLRDALFALESSLRDYPTISNSIRALNYDLEDFGRSLFLDIGDIEDELNPQEEEDDEDMGDEE